MSTYVEESIQHLKSYVKEHDEPVNIEPFIGNAVLDIHARLTVGHGFEAVKEKEPRLHFLVRHMHSAVTVIQYCGQLAYLPSAVKCIPSMFGSKDVFSVFGGLDPIGPAITKRVEGNVDPQENDFGKPTYIF